MKPPAWLLLLVAVCVATSAPAQQDALQQGLALFQQNNYAAALREFQEARRTRPPNAALENIIGITETKLGNVDAANTSYQAAIQINPKLADAHKNLGYNLIGQHKYDLAEKELKTALALDQAEPFTHYYLVVLYVTTDRDKDVVAHVKPAESALVDDTNTAVLAVKAALHAGNPGTATQLTELLQASPHFNASWQSRYNLALVWAKSDQPQQALGLLDSIVSQNEGNAEILASAAAAYESAGANDQALKAYQKAIAADPANPDRYLDSSRLLIDLNRYQEATAVVKQGMPLVPDDYPLTIRLGAIAGMQGDRTAARDAYRKAIAGHPALALGYVALAQTYMKEGSNQEALRIIADARKTVPIDFALEYVYGLISFQMGEEDQALQALTAAAKLNPEVVEPHYQLGLLFMKKQQWKQAQSEFERVLALDPRNAPTYYQLSRTYQRLGDTQKAQETSRQASALTKTQQDDAMKAQELRFGIPNKN